MAVKVSHSLDGRLTEKILQLYIDSLMLSRPLNVLTCLDLAPYSKNFKFSLVHHFMIF